MTLDADLRAPVRDLDELHARISLALRRGVIAFVEPETRVIPCLVCADIAMLGEHYKGAGMMHFGVWHDAHSNLAHLPNTACPTYAAWLVRGLRARKFSE